MKQVKSVESVDLFLSAVGYQRPFTVTFLKSNGEERTMKCMTEKSDKTPRNPNTVPVMDLEKNTWRSFNKDSVLKLEVI